MECSWPGQWLGVVKKYPLIHRRGNWRIGEFILAPTPSNVTLILGFTLTYQTRLLEAKMMFLMLNIGSQLELIDPGRLWTGPLKSFSLALSPAPAPAPLFENCVEYGSSGSGSAPASNPYSRTVFKLFPLLQPLQWFASKGPRNVGVGERSRGPKGRVAVPWSLLRDLVSIRF